MNSLDSLKTNNGVAGESERSVNFRFRVHFVLHLCEHLGAAQCVLPHHLCEPVGVAVCVLPHHLCELVSAAQCVLPKHLCELLGVAQCKSMGRLNICLKYY